MNYTQKIQNTKKYESLVAQSVGHYGVNWLVGNYCKLTLGFRSAVEDFDVWRHYLRANFHSKLTQQDRQLLAAYDSLINLRLRAEEERLLWLKSALAMEENPETVLKASDKKLNELNMIFAQLVDAEMQGHLLFEAADGKDLQRLSSIVMLWASKKNLFSNAIGDEFVQVGEAVTKSAIRVQELYKLDNPTYTNFKMPKVQPPELLLAAEPNPDRSSFRFNGAATVVDSEAEKNKIILVIAAVVVGVALILFAIFSTMSTGGSTSIISNIFTQVTSKLEFNNEKMWLKRIDGSWYSDKWKYGYELKSGTGIATISNSSKYRVGEEMIWLKASADGIFYGEQLYQDGRRHKITANLMQNGALYVSGEGNNNLYWFMERRQAAPKSNSTSPALGAGGSLSQAPNWVYFSHIGKRGEASVYVDVKSYSVIDSDSFSVRVMVSYENPRTLFFVNVPIKSYVQTMVFHCAGQTFNISNAAAFTGSYADGYPVPLNGRFDPARLWPVGNDYANLYNQRCR